MEGWTFSFQQALDGSENRFLRQHSSSDPRANENLELSRAGMSQSALTASTSLSRIENATFDSQDAREANKKSKNKVEFSVVSSKDFKTPQVFSSFGHGDDSLFWLFAHW